MNKIQAYEKIYINNRNYFFFNSDVKSTDFNGVNVRNKVQSNELFI